jgi:hypothetical protein
MALSPDAIFELVLPSQQSADDIATMVGVVQNGLPGGFHFQLLNTFGTPTTASLASDSGLQEMDLRTLN